VAANWPPRWASSSPRPAADETDVAARAVEYAANGWQVGPLCKRDPNNPRVILGPHGKEPHPRLLHGFYDFTDDVETVRRRWSKTPWNIGIRVPAQMFVLDVDGPDRLPHPGKGLQALAEAEDQHGTLPPTLTQITGSGGLQLFFRRPSGKLSATGLPAGLEYKDEGYIVAAPSIHPDSGEQYVRCDHPVATPPRWLIDMIVERPKPKPVPRRRTYTGSGTSPADLFNASNSWADVLIPHGWTCVGADPDGDGTKWLHPTHTSNCSATLRNDCLFVYSPNTPFDVTEGGNPKGYTKFRAHAVLNHGGDMSAAARDILKAA
jgi:Bifunctional DNA primase/polymerase, N-terminal